jgi:preprotein translocase subunit SecG
LVILAILICVLLALIILIQNPKGGGLSSGFAGSNNVMGVQRTGDFLEKGTWVLIISLMVIVLLINVVPQGSTSSNDNGVEVTKPATTSPLAPVAPLPTDSSKK